MSRHGYHEDCGDDDPLVLGRWRAQVRSATRGARGQKLLRDMLAALDAMPEKRLVALELECQPSTDSERAAALSKLFGREVTVDEYRERIVERDTQAREGDVCALGAVGRMRGIDMSGLDPDDSESVAAAFNIADPLAREIVWVNDEGGPARETPEHRWQRVRQWVANQIKDQ